MGSRSVYWPQRVVFIVKGEIIITHYVCFDRYKTGRREIMDFLITVLTIIMEVSSSRYQREKNSRSVNLMGESFFLQQSGEWSSSYIYRSIRLGIVPSVIPNYQHVANWVVVSCIYRNQLYILILSHVNQYNLAIFCNLLHFFNYAFLRLALSFHIRPT